MGFLIAGAGRLGSDQESLISQGVTGLFRYDLQWLVRAHQTECTLLTMDLSLQNQSGTFVNLLQWVQRIVEEGELNPDNALVRTKSSLRGAGGLRFAWGISSTVGLLSSFNAGYGETLTLDGANKWTYDTALGFSFNLLRHISVPLGVVISGRLNNLSTGGKDLSNAFQAWTIRLAYLARRDFSVSLDFINEYTRIPSLDQTVKLTDVQIALRYFF